MVQYIVSQPLSKASQSEISFAMHEKFYATLAYIRHFIFAGCYDNNHWYLVTNLAGHLDLAGFYFLNAPLILNAPLNLLLGYRPTFSSCDGGSPSLNIL
jgi:hypothetical protein